MRRWEELNKEYANKGLRFFTAYANSHPLATIEAKIKDLSLTLPVATDGYYHSRFFAPLLCVIWVIGVDGKVIHVGQEGWEQAALTELKKVKYPGLGTQTVAAPLESAAKAYGEGKLGEAAKLAEAVEKGDFDDKVIDEAEALGKRISERRRMLELRADTEEVCGDYNVALACWNELGARFGEIEYEHFTFLIRCSFRFGRLPSIRITLNVAHLPALTRIKPSSIDSAFEAEPARRRTALISRRCIRTRSCFPTSISHWRSRCSARRSCSSRTSFVAIAMC